MLRNLSILQTVDVNFGPGDPFIRRQTPHHRPLVSCRGRTSLDNLVARGDEVFFSHYNIRECTVHHEANLAEPLEACWQVHTEVMNELLIEEMRDAIDVVLVFEYTRELSNDLFVLVLLHLLAPRYGNWIKLSSGVFLT